MADPLTVYAFLIHRPQDREPWPTVFLDRERAEAYPGRCSPVQAVELTPGEAAAPPAPIRGVVSRVQVVRRGSVHAVIRFGIDEREAAAGLTPGDVVGVVRS